MAWLVDIMSREISMPVALAILSVWSAGHYAWLCWAIQRRNRLHIALATAANIELWILGPILAAHILGKLP